MSEREKAINDTILKLNWKLLLFFRICEKLIAILLYMYRNESAYIIIKYKET